MLRNLAVAAVATVTLSILFAANARAETQAFFPLTGRIVDPMGAPIAGAAVSVTNAAGTVLARTHSDSTGTFAFQLTSPAPWSVHVLSPGFAIAHRTLDEGASSVRIVLEIEGLQEAVTVVSERGADDTLRVPSPLQETPRSLSIIDADRIREQNFKTVSDALAYVPGMSVNSYRTGGYHFYARGYRMGPDETRVDGFAGVNASGRYGASLFGIERAVILRGPAGLLYGSAGSPGGFINLITKKPQETAATRIDFRTGGYAGQGVGLGARPTAAVDLDSTGRLLASGRVLYRTLVTFEDTDYFTSGVDDRNRYVNGSLTFKLDGAGNYLLIPSIQWTRFSRAPGGGIVVSPATSLTTSDGSTGPISKADLSPLRVNLSEGDSLDDTRQIGAEFRGALRPNLRVIAAYRTIAFDTALNQFAPQVTTALQREQLLTTSTVSRVQTAGETERRYHSADVSATYELARHGSWRTLFQTGLNGRISRLRSTSATGLSTTPQSPVNIYTGRVSTPLVWAEPLLTWGNATDTTYMNAYLQNQTAMANGRWVMTLGVGYGQNQIKGERVRKGEVTPNAAVVFNATPAIALYSSYATSFSPADPAVEDIDGRRGVFSPSSGANYEAGAKFGWARQLGATTVSVFHTELTNALVQSGANDLNPNGVRYFAQAGTRQSRGVEVTAELQPLSTWRLSGSVSWLDASYTGAGPASAAPTLAIPGSRAEKSPEWSTSFWTRYDRDHGRLEGLGASLGLVWQAARFGGNGARTPAAPDPLLLPAFTRVDAGLFYQLNGRVDLAVNIENLLDELIFVNGTVGSSLEVAAPRAMTVRFGYRFR